MGKRMLVRGNQGQRHKKQKKNIPIADDCKCPRLTDEELGDTRDGGPGREHSLLINITHRGARAMPRSIRGYRCACDTHGRPYRVSRNRVPSLSGTYSGIGSADHSEDNSIL